MKALVIMNKRAGTGRRRFEPEEVVEAFRRHGVEPEVREVEGGRSGPRWPPRRGWTWWSPPAATGRC